MKKNKILNQFTSIVFGNAISAILRGLSLIIFARAVMPEVLGLYSSMLGLIIVLQGISDLGLSKLIVRERSANPKSFNIYETALWLNRYLSIILCFASTLLIILAALIVDETFWMMIPLSVALAAEKNADTWLGIALADGKAYILSLNLTSRRLIALVLFLILIKWNMLPVIAMATSEAVAGLFSAYFAQRYIMFRVKPRHAVSVFGVFREARPYWLNSLSMQLRNLDVPIVTFASGAAQAGLFASASRLVSPMQLLPSALASVMLPVASRSKNRAKDIRVCFLTFLFTSLFSIILIPAISWGVPLILGSTYGGAIQPMQVIVFGLPFMATASILTSVLQGHGLGASVAKAAAAYSILLIMLLIIASAFFGAIGGAGAIVIASIIHLALLFVIIYRDRDQNTKKLF